MKISGMFYLYIIAAILLLGSGCVGIEVGELQTESRIIEIGDAASADVEFDMSSGEIDIAGGSDDLLTAEFRYNVDRWKPEITYNVRAERGELIVRQPSVIGTIRGKGINEWDLRLNENIPIDLVVDLSSGDCMFNMNNSSLEGLNIEISSGNIKAGLPGNHSLLKEVKLDISSGNIQADLGGDYPVLSALTIDSSSGNINADLIGNYSSLRAVNVDLSSGNAVANLNGSWDNDAQVEVSVSSGRIELSLPRDIGVSVDAHTSNGDIRANDFRLMDGNYVNDAYGESEITLNIKAEVSNGDIILILSD